MTRIFDDPERFTVDALAGFARAHAEDIRAVDGGVVRATPLPPGHVAVLIGGGSGHYPAFAGYVGEGMAAGAVCGNIFTSPSTAQALRVAEAADAGGGVLFTYGRYAGDVMHFGEAERRLRERGIDARTVHITDDVASAPPGSEAERRGIAGIVCVFHIAGAAAERGASLDEVERLARRTNDRTRSHGVAFSGCTLPGADHPLFDVPDGQMSIGLGIHGEPGVRDVPLQSATDLARTLLRPLLEERPADASRAVVLVNGLGSVKYEELFVLFGAVCDVLAEDDVTVVDPVCGELVTSLDMGGASVTLLWLDEELEDLWASAAWTPAFRKRGHSHTPAPQAPVSSPESAARTSSGAEPPEPARGDPASPSSLAAAAAARELLHVVHDALAREVDRLGDLDAIAGDGDHGVGMLRGITAACEAADADGEVGIRSLLEGAGDAWAEVAGGTSGALWGGALVALGSALEQKAEPASIDMQDVVRAVRAAMARIEKIGGAGVGDKTMLDAIGPYVDALDAAVDGGRPPVEALREAAEAARVAADATAALTPRRGRARPLAERSVGHPDPGAVSFSIIVDAIARRIEEE